MDSELTNEIQVQIAKGLSLTRLGDVDAMKVTDLIADRFIKDTDCVWWWEVLNQTPRIIEYVEQVGWDRIQELLDDLSEQIYFVPTDDEPNTWPVYFGTCKEVIGLLREMWRFEYILVGKEIDWLIFDTHHNSLVAVGSLAASV
jgi:hypothetical protein